MLSDLIDGERLSGHRSKTRGYPEILIYDGQGAGHGSMMCSIQGFHWAEVKMKQNKTELWFEGRTCISISGGILQYGDAEE
jgi:hypothetical protein